jgi:predicted glycosyltransferase
MVRESALLGVPSIEFIPTETYPQEQFLIDNGFPLVHVKTTEEIVKSSENYVKNFKRQSTWEKIESLENPIKIGLDLFKKKMNL